jgi:phosphoglycolate phosphatase
MNAVVFDLDGTLIDSAPDLHIAANRMLEDLRRPPLALETVASFVGNGVPTLVARCLAATGGPAKDFDYAVSRFREHYARAPAHLTRPYVGVEMMLQRLTKFGFALGICTNKPYEFAVTILEQLGMMRFIGAVVGGDTSPKLKPDPAPLLLCLDRLGAAPTSTLYVGDSEIDAETAFRAQVPFALYSGGYLRGPVDAFGPLYKFDHFEDLSDYMLQKGAGRRDARKS